MVTIQDATIAEYRGAGLDYGPPLEPLETLGELRRVLGMTPATFAAIRPHLSLFAPTIPSPVNADPVVAAARSDRVPRQLRVEVSVDVDEARRDHPIGGIDHPGCRTDDVGGDVDDLIVDDRYISHPRRRTRAIDHRAMANEHVERTHQMPTPVDTGP